MKTQKNELIDRLLENYIMGHISKKEFDAMIEVAEQRNIPLSDNAKNPNFVMYMRVGNESQLK